MEQRFTFLLLLSLVVSPHANGNSIFETHLSIVDKPLPTSVEFRAQRMISTKVHEYCFKHVVQFRLPKAADQPWHFANIGEKMDGRFVLSALKPGETYEVRAACKDDKIPPSMVGEWSTPVPFTTPLSIQKEEPEQPKKEEKKKEEVGKNGAITTRQTLITLVTAFILFTKFL